MFHVGYLFADVISEKIKEKDELPTQAKLAEVVISNEPLYIQAEDVKKAADLKKAEDAKKAEDVKKAEDAKEAAAVKAKGRPGISKPKKGLENNGQ